MKIRAVVVDDEPLARRRLRRLLEEHDDVEVVGEAATGDEALATTLDTRPDLLFLDVRMPGKDGLETLRGVRGKLPDGVCPLAVFTTAYEEHAVEAFALDGTDYLIKPVGKSELNRAMQRVRRTLWQRGRAVAEDEEPAGMAPPTRRQRGESAEAGSSTGTGSVGHLAGHRAGKIIRLALTDIACIRVDDTITWAVTAEGRFRLRQGLAQLEERLDCPPFFRVSRSVIVNLAWVDHLAPMFSGTYSAFLKDPVSLEAHVSRRRARELRQLLGW